MTKTDDERAEVWNIVTLQPPINLLKPSGNFTYHQV
jgi:hypothetical protein